MPYPAVAKTWMFTVNNRVAFSSLNDTMSKLLYGIKNFLVATVGYTVKYTCNGTTGPSSSSDHTDRWSSASNATTRGANTTSANSFAVLTDANGCDVCFSYVGATDDVARISFSPGGLYVPAGTATNTPTATDENVVVSATSLINSATSLDRVWHCLATNEQKGFRVIVARGASSVGTYWGVEAVSSRTIVPFSPSVWGFSISATSGVTFGNIFGSTTTGGTIRLLANNISVIGIIEGLNTFNTQGGVWQNTKTELQGAIGFPMRPLSIGSSTSGFQGPIAYLIDWWFGRNASGATNWADGDMYGGNKFFGATHGMVWPWDNSSDSQTA